MYWIHFWRGRPWPSPLPIENDSVHCRPPPRDDAADVAAVALERAGDPVADPAIASIWPFCSEEKNVPP